jgi:uncharacterized membrane protein YgcG
LFGFPCTLRVALTCVPTQVNLTASLVVARNDAHGLLIACSERHEALVLSADGGASHRALSSDELAWLATQHGRLQTSNSVGNGDDDAQAHAVLGVLELFGERFAWLASDVVLEGELRRGERVLRIMRSALVRVGTLSSALSESEQSAQRAAVDQLLDFLNDDLRLYASPDFDVTRRTADRLRAPTAPPDPRFCWNAAWAKALRAGAPHWAVAVVDGFFQAETVAAGRLVLWARRSALAQGARYHARGVTLAGDVANMVETEQLLLAGDRATVFTIVRGSIPIWWHQQGGELFKPPPVPFAAATTQAVLRRHYDSLLASYGAPVVTVSLIDLTGGEGVLAMHFREAMQQATSADARLLFHEFDFHERTKGSRYENVSELLAQLLPRIAASGVTTIDEHGRVLESQTGVVRVNCIDCLDRTNVVQSMIAMRALDAQVAKLGLVGVAPNGEAFRSVWSEQADALSQAYTSASALKTDFTRTGKRSLAGRIGDSLTSVKRLMNRAFTDAEKQEMLDVFLARRTLIGLNSTRQRFGQLSPAWKARSERNSEIWLAVDAAARTLLVADVASHELQSIALVDAAERVWPDINRPNVAWLALNQFCPPRTSCAALANNKGDGNKGESSSSSSSSSSSRGDSSSASRGDSSSSSSGGGGGSGAADADSVAGTNFLLQRAVSVSLENVTARQSFLRAIGAATDAPVVTMIAVSVDVDHCDAASVGAMNSSWLSSVIGADTDIVSIAVFAGERALATANTMRLPVQAQLGADWHLVARHVDEQGSSAILVFVRARTAALVSNIELTHVRSVRETNSLAAPANRKFSGLRDKLKQASEKIKDTTRQLSGAGRSEGNRAVIGPAVTFALGDWLRVGVFASRDDRDRDVDAALANGTMIESIDACVYLASSQAHLPANFARRDAWMPCDGAKRVSFLGRSDGTVVATTKSLACDVTSNRTDNTLCARMRLAPIAYDASQPVAKDLSLSVCKATLLFEPGAPAREDLTMLLFARCLAVGVAVRPTPGAGDSWALPPTVELEVATPLAVAARSRIHVELWSRRKLVCFGCFSLAAVLSSAGRETRAVPMSIELCSKSLEPLGKLQFSLDARWPAADQLLQRRQSQVGKLETFAPGSQDLRNSLGARTASIPSLGSDDDFQRALSPTLPSSSATTTTTTTGTTGTAEAAPAPTAPLISLMDL